MSLPQFSIIVAVDSENGISKHGEIPWDSKDDMTFFKNTTKGNGRNAVIMGRKTWETIGAPLEGRTNVIISSNMNPVDYPTLKIAKSFKDALQMIGSVDNYEDVFVMGGEQVYNEAIADYLYLCKRIYVTKFKKNYMCDQFFPFDVVSKFKTEKEPANTSTYIRYVYTPQISHDEYKFLELLKKVRDFGDNRADRTGKGTVSLFGERMEFDISERIPILTTKKIFHEMIIEELLFFLSGKTDTKILESKNVKIWKDNTSAEFIKNRGLEYNEGDMGPAYGYQWRHWGLKYEGCDKVPGLGEGGIDQIKKIVDGIRNEPFSRRHILTSYNVSQLDEMVLEPCHLLAQFYVSSDRKYLDCQLYQRSADMFLGVPFNIASYSILTYMIAHVCGLLPRKFIHVMGDTHIYRDHLTQVNTQLKRTPWPFPKLIFRDTLRLKEIDDFTSDSFYIQGYRDRHWSIINAKMAI